MVVSLMEIILAPEPIPVPETDWPTAILVALLTVIVEAPLVPVAVGVNDNTWGVMYKIISPTKALLPEDQNLNPGLW